MSIIKDYDLLKEKALRAIDNYLAPGSSKEGMFHGELGITRAEKLKEYLEASSKPSEILVCLLSVFGLDTSFQASSGIGSWFKGKFKKHRNLSYGLTSEIAKECISGSYRVTNSLYQTESTINDDLASDVFPKVALDLAKHAPYAVSVSGSETMSFSTFEPRLGMTFLLRKALDTAEFASKKADLIEAVRNIQETLDTKDAKVDLSLLPSIEMQEVIKGRSY